MEIIAEHRADEFSGSTNYANKKGLTHAFGIGTNEDIPEEGAGEEPEKETSVSTGVATYPDEAETKSELLKKADGALYWAKDSGKNKVVIFDEN